MASVNNLSGSVKILEANKDTIRVEGLNLLDYADVDSFNGSDSIECWLHTEAAVQRYTDDLWEALASKLVKALELNTCWTKTPFGTLVCHNYQNWTRYKVYCEFPRTSSTGLILSNFSVFEFFSSILSTSDGSELPSFWTNFTSSFLEPNFVFRHPNATDSLYPSTETFFDWSYFPHPAASPPVPPGGSISYDTYSPETEPTGVWGPTGSVVEPSSPYRYTFEDDSWMHGQPTPLPEFTSVIEDITVWDSANDMSYLIPEPSSATAGPLPATTFQPEAVSSATSLNQSVTSTARPVLGGALLLCPCPCAGLTVGIGVDLQQAEAEVQKNIKDTQKRLSVNVSQLSANVRKKTSASDTRASAQITGMSIGIAIVFLVFSLIVLADCMSVVAYFVNLYSLRWGRTREGGWR
ncbi:uncharacterized protein LOC101846633 [Aplysia californica]|uniref:Uncharacterized protein LOC101846633 n=1 Tax=Aplysia californica TaxID=6500 RepID=A0ABM0ZVH6_APLCA|nr:uncharacterized protein LOC101846633 [Aplysia californica]